MSAPTTISRGTKRKRTAPSPEDALATKFAGKLHHELKEVRKAAKKARTFETQRVVKKLKELRKKNSATADVDALEAELEELKTIDSDIIAATALRTRLHKDRHINDSASASAAIARELPASISLPNSTNPKVQARFLSARALGAAVTDAVTGLRAVLLPPADEENAAVIGMDNELGDEDEDQEDNANANEEGEDEVGEEAGWESGSVGVDEEGDAAEDGWESGSIHSANSDVDDSDEDEDTAPPKKKPAKADSPSTKKAAASSSQFLPSLSVGYIRGGSSDSEVEDIDEGGERKNRRGQRARRAIWEKKYGRGANHKKKEAEAAAKEREVKKAQWEARQAKREAEAKRWSEQKARGVDGGWAGRAGAKQATVTGQPRNAYTGQDKTAGMHPSWLAKKAMKEKMGVGGGLGGQGKKIVFD
ncbi:Bud-site selection protein [Favolaschia claudopus]|uniref:Bud-site selection protein n=1 Tax=Favolaschia claudopus TaxID=2862362 RepID=A0AAW0D6V2_9AGAR